MKLIRTSTLLRRVGGLLSIGHESWSFAFGTGKSESVAKECMHAKYDLVQLRDILPCCESPKSKKKPVVKFEKIVVLCVFLYLYLHSRCFRFHYFQGSWRGGEILPWVKGSQLSFIRSSILAKAPRFFGFLALQYLRFSVTFLGLPWIAQSSFAAIFVACFWPVVRAKSLGPNAFIIGCPSACAQKS